MDIDHDIDTILAMSDRGESCVHTWEHTNAHRRARLEIRLYIAQQNQPCTQTQLYTAYTVQSTES